MRARHLHAALHTLELLPVKYSTDYHPPPKLTYERALELPTIDVIATRHPWIPLLCRQVTPANKLVVILIPTVVNKHENKAGPRKEQSSVRLWPHFYRAFQNMHHSQVGYATVLYALGNEVHIVITLSNHNRIIENKHTVVGH